MKFTIMVVALCVIGLLNGTTAMKADASDFCCETEELIFHSGFEPDSKGVPENVHKDIEGTDHSVSPPNDWVEDLEGHENIGYFKIQYQGGDVTDRYARIIEDPTNSENNVLKFWLNKASIPIDEDSKKGRIQANLYRNYNLTEIYQKVRLYIGDDFNILKGFPDEFYWLTLLEFWNNANWTSEDYPFRITLGIAKDKPNAVESLFFLVVGQIYTGCPRIQDSRKL